MAIMLKGEDGWKRFFQNQDQVIDYLETQGKVKVIEP